MQGFGFISLQKRFSWIKRILIVCALTSCLFIIFTLLIHTGLIVNDGEDLAIFSIIYFLLAILFIYIAELSSILKYELVKSQSLKKAIFIPLIIFPFVKIVVSFVVNIFPILNGSIGPIGIVPRVRETIVNDGFTLSCIIYWCLCPALLEELLFRFIGFRGFEIFLKSISINVTSINKSKSKKINFLQNKCLLFSKIFDGIIKYVYNQLFIKKTKVALSIWIMITSTLFSLGHDNSFFIHFISGVFFSIFYLNYGLVSSIVAHFIGNCSVFLISDLLNLIF